MSDSFRASRLKIERAKKHIIELEALVGAFFQSDPYSILVKNDLHGMNQIELSHFGGLPMESPLVIGDAIHNMRSSLDILMCDIARLRGCPTPPTWMKFPIGDSKKKLESDLTGEIKRLIGDTVIDILINNIKAYRGRKGNVPLCALHDLDVMDKHKLLVPVVSRAMFTGVSSRNALIRNSRFVVSQGAKLHLLSNAEDFDLTDNKKPTLTITFNHGQAREGEPIIPTLHQFSQVVSGIVDIIDNLEVATGK